jgi:competence protein ComEA
VSERLSPQLLVYALAGVIAVVALLRLVHHGGSGGGPPGPAVRVGAAAGETRAGGRAVYVHVAGAVRRPGLYRLSAGARTAAAIDRAGGATRRGDLTTVNLAAQLQDGQQIVVPKRGAAVAAASGAGAAGRTAAGQSGGAGGPPSGPISLSTATAQQLDGLDGIGPTLAARIVQYRDAHGGFRSVEDLRNVQGVGEKRFEALRKAVAP